jgi:RNA polymerase sigma factor (sigma-70 family)
MRRFRGDSRLETYLRVVVHRLFLDFRAACWGNWRSSARARSLGRAALMLERLLYRDGMTRDEARHELEAQGFQLDDDEIELLVQQLPYRPKRRQVRVDILDRAQGCDGNRGLSPAESTLSAERFETAFAAAASELSGEDRLVLKLRFIDEATILEIAEALGSTEASVNLRLSRLLRQLRKRLEARGLDGAAAKTIWLENVPFDLESALQKACAATFVQTTGREIEGHEEKRMPIGRGYGEVGGTGTR